MPSPTEVPSGDDTLTVVDVPERGRFELRNADDVLGYADYRSVGDDTVEMPHTVISPAHRGKGLGDVLVEGAVRQLNERHVTIVPTCWFVAEYLERHPQQR
ncbi:MAG: N-acetyltransferase [Actinomycetota bacterium]|nr:N-acetyltransferase [Actinomycetota bacterium]